MREVLFISLGAVAGANARYYFERWVTNLLGRELSWGILFINILGSLLVGFFAAFVMARAVTDPRWRLLIVVGFAGAFTTFSTYAFESVQYLRAGMYLQFWSNVLLNNLLCMAAVAVGATLGTGVARIV